MCFCLLIADLVYYGGNSHYLFEKSELPQSNNDSPALFLQVTLYTQHPALTSRLKVESKYVASLTKSQLYPCQL